MVRLQDTCASSEPSSHWTGSGQEEVGPCNTQSDHRLRRCAWIVVPFCLATYWSAPTTLIAQEATDDGLAVLGQADYDWTIRPLDGEPIELASLRGEVLFINLWASWCTPCIREMETIEGLAGRLSDADVEFLIVAAEGEGPVRRHLRRYSYDLPIYLEVDRIPSAFGLRGLPTSWVVDRAGRILILRHGEAVWDTDEVEAFMRRVAG